MAVHSRVEIHPPPLLHVADRLDDVARLLPTIRDRLSEMTEMVALNLQDPEVNTSLRRERPIRVSNHLIEAGRQYAADAALCRATAFAAQSADASIADGASRSVMCRIPPGYRRPIDRAMTHAIGSGLAHVVTAGAGLFELVADGIGVGEPKVSGDPGGTYTVRPVGLDAVNEPNVVALSLAAMNDRRLLANDEFGLISHGDQRFTVVLPGVSDLSVPGRGLNAVHRTVRDLDEVAISSARYAGVEHNLYAKMVMAALDQNNVGRGAELLLVGHSFGADTALDLAADPEFVGRYRVIQVVATGYNHGPQLNRTGADVNVLVVRNPNDLVVAAMTLMPTEQTGVFGCQVEPTPPAGTAVVNVDGGWSGIGHSVSHYKKVFLVGGEPNQPDGAAVSAVLGRLDSAGFGLPDQMLAVDVTVPVGPGEHPSGLD